ncbi:UNVERIFIED_CONTAM: hypothetical protein Sindi_2843900, partial [Sesamum indicum]
GVCKAFVELPLRCWRKQAESSFQKILEPGKGCCCFVSTGKKPSPRSAADVAKTTKGVSVSPLSCSDKTDPQLAQPFEELDHFWKISHTTYDDHMDLHPNHLRMENMTFFFAELGLMNYSAFNCIGVCKAFVELPLRCWRKQAESSFEKILEPGKGCCCFVSTGKKPSPRSAADVAKTTKGVSVSPLSCSDKTDPQFAQPFAELDHFWKISHTTYDDHMDLHPNHLRRKWGLPSTMRILLFSSTLCISHCFRKRRAVIGISPDEDKSCKSGRKLREGSSKKPNNFASVQDLFNKTLTSFLESLDVGTSNLEYAAGLEEVETSSFVLLVLFRVYEWSFRSPGRIQVHLYEKNVA